MSSLNISKIGLVKPHGLLLEDPDLYRDTCLSESLHSPPCHQGIRIVGSDDHLGDPGFYEGLSTGRGFSVMGAWLNGDEAHGTPGHPRDLPDHKGIYYGHRGWIENWIFIGPDGEHHSDAALKMKSNNGDVMKAAAVAGAGLVTMPTFITWNEVEAGRLVPVLPDYRARDLGLYAVYPPTHNLSAKVRVFIDFLVETFGPEPYWDLPFIVSRTPGADAKANTLDC